MKATVAAALMLALLVLALPLQSALASRRRRKPSELGSAKLMRYARTIVVLWTLCGLAVYALALHGLSPRDVGLRPPRSIVDLFLGAAVVIALLASGRRRPADGEYLQAIRAVVPSSRAEWALFLPLALSAGVCEEFLYRGYALTVIASLSGSLIVGVCLSSLAFGAAHAYQGRTGMLAAFGSGLFYAALFLYTGSLYPCMLGHFAQDLCGAALLSGALRRGMFATRES
ncbi:MAG: CPBP family intramembrane glutamic endopeptidase [Candidatus Eremiobacter antarcticus]|nr:CPBP family intramembrane metalloprotease [Candidatus Eremiobacteraeota bacterium]MBC5808322.1 CPBP family intramembrane metalloprotease [Candidatus Eremiobacteraeota bacterium]